MSLRFRLALIYTVAFLIALAILGSAIYLILRQTLTTGIDDELADLAGQIERAVVIRGGDRLDAQHLLDEMFVLSPPTPGQELRAQNIHIHILGTDGRSLASSSLTAETVPLDPEAVAAAASGEDIYQTVRIGGVRLRSRYSPLTINGETVAVVQLSESLSPMMKTIAEFRTLLLAGGILALLGGLIGTWSLTRQALQPVSDLTNRVARIAETGEFNERVPEADEPDEIGRLALTFNALLDRISLMLDRQRTLVADTSHELRNPLMVVRGNLELLAAGLPPEEQRDAARDAIEEVDRMTRLVQDLLFLADADADLAIEHDDVPLEALVANVVDDAQRITTRDDGVRTLELTANDSLTIRGDAERLRQLIWNLVENALRYTPAGGTVSVSLRRHGQVAELTVADTGIGIGPEHLPHIFERFYRADTGRSRAVGGTGLGLSIVRQITEAHGGQVRVRSTPGEGSTFTVALPISED
ncbi:MAG: ATP-binding protein [Thermomicrobiales bacterium]|nr:ATP-binding protein [Thermomicrobiales bacterium]